MMEMFKELLPFWWNIPPAQLSTVLMNTVTVGWGSVNSWLEERPDLLVHPRDLIDESTLGIHQSWSTNLMPFRIHGFHGRTIYLFQEDIDTILSKLAA